MFPSPFSASDYRSKWKKRRKESDLKNIGKKQKSYPDDDDDDEDEEEDIPIEYDDTNDDNDNKDDHTTAAEPNSNQTEVLSGTAVKLCIFPNVVKHEISRAHPIVLALVAAERDEKLRSESSVILENISHGQLQTLSAIPADSPYLLPPDQEKSEGNFMYVCAPPEVLLGSGVTKTFGDSTPHFMPMHADWFSETTVHRLERQVVPHFFSGKSNAHSPERYKEIRNSIISKYLENPQVMLLPADCQGLVEGVDNQDVNRVARFLDQWGIINYTASSVQQLSKLGGFFQEDTNGDFQVSSGMLKTIESLMHFDKPRSRQKISGDYSNMVDTHRASDLDHKLQEKFSEYSCHCCLKSLAYIYYQSQKEVDIILCVDCFHDGKFVAGHTSIDFVRVDPSQGLSDLDGDNWSDQETFLLLEAVEMYNDNWNEISEHVGTKTKAQCLFHFIRLPIHATLLENIDVHVTCDDSKGNIFESSFCSNMNDLSKNEGDVLQSESAKDQIPFANSENPVMSLVGFLTSAVGPRVGAACARASLTSLCKDDSSVQMESSVQGGALNSQGLDTEDSCNESFAGAGLQKEDATSRPLLSAEVIAAAELGLSAAAMKSKLFAEHEEREIQRLVASIVNNKLRRLELKLKQFAELETLLMKECEQMESTRQKMAAERMRLMSLRLSQRDATLQPALSNTKANSQGVNDNWQSVTASSCGSPISALNNNQVAYSQMAFMPRQPIYSFGSRLPISIANSSTAPSTLPSTSVSVTSHSVLRTMSGMNTSIS